VNNQNLKMSTYNLTRKVNVEMSAGCTALFVLLNRNQILIANAGDSRCVLARKNLKEEFVKITTEHKPAHKIENQRIRKAGGKVVDGFKL
jgi:protein phosphatase 1G